MAAPELVIADAPFKTYPGNVIAVRCADWTAGARGTLSTESDALASTGQAVRDTQQVTNIIGGTAAAYAAADDTLVLTGLPFVDDRYYYLYATIRIEGYLDVTDGAVLRTCFNENWANATVFGVHGAGVYTFTAETTPLASNHCPPPLPYYRAVGLSNPTVPSFRISDKTEPLYLRMASETGTTIEWLLDQLVFLPVPYNSHDIRGPGDIFGTTITVQDGVDGGDANGKFTWFPNQPQDGFSAPGDYQHIADGDDAEYFAEIDKDDFYELFDGTDFAGEKDSFFYSLHTANFRGDRTWSEDTFDNRDTTGTQPDWGISPEGIGYAISLVFAAGLDATAFVDGTGGYLQLNDPDGFDEVQVIWGSGSTGTAGSQNQGMKHMLYDEFAWSGVWENTQGEFAPGSDSFFSLQVFNTFYSVNVYFDTTQKQWRIFQGISYDSGWIDMSAWFSIGALVGWKIEYKRYLARVRVWDASGAEPSTWDYEGFLDISGNTYPYGDSEDIARRISNPTNALIFDLESQGHTDTVPMEIKIHQHKTEHIAYGDGSDMSVRIERPEGTTAGEIVVPFGSSYFVYWGKRDWTEHNSGPDYSVEFSAKVWNDPAAAEIQRAEAQIFYLFWIGGGHIIPMNWRSSDRKNSANRILLGSR